MNHVTRILRASTRQSGDQMNILVMGATHERTETNLASTGHRFFMLRGPGLKTWDARFAPLPLNYVPVADVPSGFPVDLVLSQTRGHQFSLAASLATRLGVPHINLAHTLPPPAWRPKGQGVSADLNVFISDYSRREWGFADDPAARVIEHGVDTRFFCPGGGHRRPVVLAVANQYEKRDAELGYSFFKEATAEFPTRVVGDNPGLGEPARSLDHLRYAYRSSLVFVNTARRSPVPTSLLEAMACGCAVVSTRNPMVETVIEHNVNGVLVDSPAEMADAIRYFLDNEDVAVGTGLYAHSTISDRFCVDRFVDDWKQLFEEAADI